jgi:hypothetical protein
MGKKLWWTLGIILVLILVLAGFYFTQINNVFAQKKNLEKPDVDISLLLSNPGTQVIFEEHIDYLTNELGVYKLHSYDDENAVIVFEIVDIDKKIALIKNGKSHATEDIPDNYDLLIKGEQLVVAELIDSENLSENLIKAVEEGKISVELISDMTTLGLKGFLAIYDELGA